MSPTLTALTFKVWEGGLTPGREIGSFAGLDYSQGEHTAYMYVPLPDVDFIYFGLTQPQSTAALRVGLDTSSGAPTKSFIRAPGCGLSAWQTLDGIGFPGNWVMTATVQGFVGPIELQSWGGVKATFQPE